MTPVPRLPTLRAGGHMEIAMIGLGRMGANMARRLMRNGVWVG